MLIDYQTTDTCMSDSQRSQGRIGTSDIVDVYAPESRHLHVRFSPFLSYILDRLINTALV